MVAHARPRRNKIVQGVGSRFFVTTPVSSLLTARWCVKVRLQLEES